MQALRLSRPYTTALAKPRFFTSGMHYRDVSFWTLNAAAGQDLLTVLLPADFSLM
jgi:hypothetical protein